MSGGEQSAEKGVMEAPFDSLPGAVELARYFWHEMVLKQHLGNYHGCDGIGLWRDGGDYCYLWVEATVDHEMWASYLFDVRTNIGAIETRDYVLLQAGVNDLFDVEWRNKPIRFDAQTATHIERLRDGLEWLSQRVIECAERRA